MRLKGLMVRRSCAYLTDESMVNQLTSQIFGAVSWKKKNLLLHISHIFSILFSKNKCNKNTFECFKIDLHGKTSQLSWRWSLSSIFKKRESYRERKDRWCTMSTVFQGKKRSKTKCQKHFNSHDSLCLPHSLPNYSESVQPVRNHKDLAIKCLFSVAQIKHTGFLREQSLIE